MLLKLGMLLETQIHQKTTHKGSKVEKERFTVFQSKEDLAAVGQVTALQIILLANIKK